MPEFTWRNSACRDWAGNDLLQFVGGSGLSSRDNYAFNPYGTSAAPGADRAADRPHPPIRAATRTPHPRAPLPG